MASHTPAHSTDQVEALKTPHEPLPILDEIVTLGKNIKANVMIAP